MISRSYRSYRATWSTKNGNSYVTSSTWTEYLAEHNTQQVQTLRFSRSAALIRAGMPKPRNIHARPKNFATQHRRPETPNGSSPEGGRQPCRLPLGQIQAAAPSTRSWNSSLFFSAFRSQSRSSDGNPPCWNHCHRRTRSASCSKPFNHPRPTRNVRLAVRKVLACAGLSRAPRLVVDAIDTAAKL
jgi:hypothetical protein